ncbi:MAG TPA: type I DNA topoisomerase [Anaerolineales bacterium]|nr:type I DNA topoisomerase [Anaerolineales bacterium]
MEAYCVKCKTKRAIEEPQPVFTKNATPATQGKCGVCGTTMFRMGKTPAHETMVPPVVESRKTKQKPRSGKLVIVESPAKARTIGKYLGRDYTVRASVGHIRDLLRSQLSVDVENDFEPKYRVPNDKRGVVKELKKLADRAREIFLATDPDREGEAIAWHLKAAVDMEDDITHRVVFNEITRDAVVAAFEHPREIDMDLVDAQQARRVLDRLVGYNLSPILWRKVRGRLSAGRVQSVALRIVVDREREIDDFIPEEYWTVNAELRADAADASDADQTYLARLTRIDKEKVELGTREEVDPILEDMERAEYRISKIKRGTRRRKPQAPFTTSTLQQEASSRLGFTARKTMAVAQQLYEGLDVGEGAETGLITYMRTDSTNVSELAQLAAREFVSGRYGGGYLPDKPPEYKTRARSAQEAHEAIRPTVVTREPKTLKPHLTRDQHRLYTLIWQRFVASQMAPAVYDTLTIQVTGTTGDHRYQLRAGGSTLKFPGFLAVYADVDDPDSDDPRENGAKIPEGLVEGQRQDLVRLIPEQHFTQPPPRFSEASLVKALEENGIGRPSTYAPTLSTLQNRNYVDREGRALIPTETGFVVNDLLAEYFPNILDIGFTARMEEQLDKIADGDRKWVEPIREFYGPFSEQVEVALHEMPEVRSEPEPIGRKCPETGHELVIRWGRFGKFISCSGFPDCRYTEPWLEKIGVLCPVDGGDLVERKTRRGRVFYGCENYPGCEFTSWKRPLAAPCPNCGGLLVAANQKLAQCIKCENRYPLEEVQSDH